MSRNTKIRQMADKLPEAPNLINGKPQYDSAGKLIMANHFRNLKEIQDKCEKLGFGAKSPETLVSTNNYIQSVLSYNKRKIMKEKASFYVVWAFMMISIIAIIIKYWR